jgi:hypothetical protein
MASMLRLAYQAVDCAEVHDMLVDERLHYLAENACERYGSVVGRLLLTRIFVWISPFFVWISPVLNFLGRKSKKKLFFVWISSIRQIFGFPVLPF